VSVPTSLHSYTDCVELFDRALESKAGIRVRMDSGEAATNFRMRMHQARKLHREQNKLTYQPDHPMFGTSPYDAYTLRIRAEDNTVWLYLEPNLSVLDKVEDLSGHQPLSEETFTRLVAPVEPGSITYVDDFATTPVPSPTIRRKI